MKFSQKSFGTVSQSSGYYRSRCILLICGWNRAGKWRFDPAIQLKHWRYRYKASDGIFRTRALTRTELKRFITSCEAYFDFLSKVTRKRSRVLVKLFAKLLHCAPLETESFFIGKYIFVAWYMVEVSTAEWAHSTGMLQPCIVHVSLVLCRNVERWSVRAAGNVQNFTFQNFHRGWRKCDERNYHREATKLNLIPQYLHQNFAYHGK